MLLHSLLYCRTLTDPTANQVLTYFKEFSLAEQKQKVLTKKDNQPVSQTFMT